MSGQYRSRAMASIYETAEGLHAIGLMERMPRKMVVGQFAVCTVMARLDRALRSTRRSAKEEPVRPGHDGKTPN